MMHRTPIAERFWPRVNKTDSCWLWTGSKNNKGYGVIGRGGNNGGMMYVHRLSFSIANPGANMAGMAVMHKCDMPPCVNPDHLSLGTLADNHRDMWLKGRMNPPKGENSPKAKLTESQVMEIRRRFRPTVFSNTKELAKEFGVTQQSITAIVCGKNWKHIPQEKPC